MKNKTIKIVILIALTLLLVGCNGYDTTHAYFDLGTICDCNQTGCDREQKCKDLCENSGIRISDNRNVAEVNFDNGIYICDCY